MTHSFQIFDLGSKLNAMFSMGAKVVQMFFVASSFTLFLSFNHRKNTEERYIRNFFIRRFFRIAPMYYIVICFFFLTKEIEDSNQLASFLFIILSTLIISQFTYTFIEFPFQKFKKKLLKQPQKFNIFNYNEIK